MILVERRCFLLKVFLFFCHFVEWINHLNIHNGSKQMSNPLDSLTPFNDFFFSAVHSSLKCRWMFVVVMFFVGHKIKVRFSMNLINSAGNLTNFFFANGSFQPKMRLSCDRIMFKWSLFAWEPNSMKWRLLICAWRINETMMIYELLYLDKVYRGRGFIFAFFWVIKEQCNHPLIHSRVRIVQNATPVSVKDH